MTKLITRHIFSDRKMLLVAMLSLFLTSCSLSAKSIYYDREQAVAERAVSQFHEFHNQEKAEAIYDLMDRTAIDSESRFQTLVDIKRTFETVGRVKSAILAERKVFPAPTSGFTSQVKLVYDTESEKGNWTEFFSWNIKNSREAILAEYHVTLKN